MTMRRAAARKRRGGVLLETAMFVPVLVMLLVGVTELARVSFTYYALQKTMYTVARYVGTQQGVNFCDGNDAIVLGAKNLAVTGTLDGSGPALVRNLTTDLISVRVERFDALNQSLGQCDCSVNGCDAAAGGLPPDFIVVDLPDGYTVKPIFPQLNITPFELRPRVRVPYGGT